MKKNNLNEENYFSNEMNMKYTGSSQIKSFVSCEAKTLAELKGEWEEKKSEAMSVSSYIDEAISGTLDTFKQQNSQIFTQKGELKAQYKIADKVLEQIKNDPMFYKYLSGEHQKIMTGEISGVLVKIKIDSYFEDKLIVDLKAMKDFKLIWNDKTNEKQSFVEFYDYILQAALYQEIVRQNTGKKLPFIIAACTKQEISERALLSIPQEELDLKLEFLRNYLPHIQELKEGKVEPVSCGHCEYCLSKKKTEKIYNYEYYFTQRNKGEI